MEAENPTNTHFFTPIVRKICVLCRRDITFSVQILASIDEDRLEHLNFCPSCFCSQNNKFKIYEYQVLNDQTQEPAKLQGISLQDIGQTLCQIKKNGIQSVIKNSECPELCETYENLNQSIFKQRQDMYLSLSDKNYDPARYQPFRKPNIPNKKQLEALGYCFERKQFNYLPQSIYEQMLGRYDQEEASNDKSQKIMTILCNQYDKQQGEIAQVQQHIIDSSYLLPRKDSGCKRRETRQLTKLVAMKDPIKQLFHCANKFIQNNRTPTNMNLFNAWKEKKDERDHKKQKKRLRKQQQMINNSESSFQKDQSHYQEQNVQHNSIETIHDIQIGTEQAKKKRGRPKGWSLKDKKMEQTTIVLQTKASSKKIQLRGKKQMKRLSKRVVSSLQQ